MVSYADNQVEHATLSMLFLSLVNLCRETEKPVVLMIDEVDSASNNQVFIDFLAQLRFYYLTSRLCKFVDEQISGNERFPDRKSAWTKEGILEAVKLLENESNSLFQSMKGKLKEFPELRSVLYDLLFTGKPVPYSSMNDYIEIAAMFGFVKNKNGSAVISNRIFEAVLYNWFMSEEYVGSRIYDAGAREKNQFVVGGHLNVRRILEKFAESFDELCGDRDETFLEDAGRRYFMLFLKPIINGEGAGGGGSVNGKFTLLFGPRIAFIILGGIPDHYLTLLGVQRVFSKDGLALLHRTLILLHRHLSHGYLHAEPAVHTGQNLHTTVGAVEKLQPLVQIF